MPIEFLIFLAKLFYAGYSKSKDVSLNSLSKKYVKTSEQIASTTHKAHKAAIERSAEEADFYVQAAKDFLAERVAAEKKVTEKQKSLLAKKADVLKKERELRSL